jgi:transcriptional regulator with XRE-family HTH domain
VTENETFGQMLKRLRKDRPLTLRDLEKEIGVKYAYLSQLEAGLAKPSEELARKLAKYFGEDEEKFVFLARDIRKVIDDLKKKYPKQAPAFFRKVLKEERGEK